MWLRGLRLEEWAEELREENGELLEKVCREEAIKEAIEAAKTPEDASDMPRSLRR